MQRGQGLKFQNAEMQQAGTQKASAKATPYIIPFPAPGQTMMEHVLRGKASKNK